MKKFHIAIGVANIEQSILDYSTRLEQQPEIVIAGEYALWRTDTLNFSIRKIEGKAGVVRHLGWEEANASGFSAEPDVNGIIWEKFNQQEQLNEIARAWPTYQSTQST